MPSVTITATDLSGCGCPDCPSGPCGTCAPCEYCGLVNGEEYSCVTCSVDDFGSCLGLDTATHPACNVYDFNGDGFVTFEDIGGYNAACDDCG